VAFRATEEAIMPLQHAGLAALYGNAFLSDPAAFDVDIAQQIERGLSWTSVDVGPRGRLANRFRVGAIVLLPLDVWLHVRRWHQPHRMPQCCCGLSRQSSRPLPALGQSEEQSPVIEPRVLTGGLFLGRCWQDGHQVGERVMAGAVMEHIPASLAEQQKHLFRWAVGSDSRIDRAAMLARKINCLIAGDGHPNPLPTR
jgi:hypothetical protein